MKRQYSRYDKAWYADQCYLSNTISFGMYHQDGSTSGEMNMRWVMLDNNLVPKLECFDDAWKVLSEFSDVIENLAKFDNKNMSQDEFCQLLDKCKFKDTTPYKNEKHKHKNIKS